MKRSHKKQIRTPYKEGVIEFTAGNVSVTDPSYDRESFGKINGIEIIPGTYICNTIYGKDNERIAMQLVLNDDKIIKTVNANHSWISVGTVTSETKTIGVFQNKPNFKAYKLGQVINGVALCRIWSDKTYKGEPKGFIFYLTKDLPEYKVRVVKSKDRVVAIEISLV